MAARVFSLAVRFVAGALAAVFAQAAVAHADEAPKREPHPTMALFLEEIGSGQLEKAAARIATVNDLFGLQTRYLRFNQAELVSLLATCELAEHTSLHSYVAIEKTAWDCADGERHLMIFNSAGEAPNPYLYVGRIETARMQADREAILAEAFAAGELPTPPIALSMASSPEELARREEERRLAAVAANAKRDKVGEAFVTGDLADVVRFVTGDTDAAYMTHDPFFDVKIKHINGKGLADLELVLATAVKELRRPVSAECYKGEGRWAPHICRWQLQDPAKAMVAEMNFAGENGTLSSIRVYRQTAEELAKLREQAIETGVING